MCWMRLRTCFGRPVESMAGRLPRAFSNVALDLHTVPVVASRGLGLSIVLQGVG